jgi:hypothetical protein
VNRTRTRALVLSLALGLAAIAAVFALGRTLSLGDQASAANDRAVERRTAQLDRYEASLRKALAQKPPALPPLEQVDGNSGLQSAAPARVVYHRPPPIVVSSRTAGEHENEAEHENGHESEYEGAEADD